MQDARASQRRLVAGATLILLLSPSRDSAGFPRGKWAMGAQEENVIT